MSSPTTSTPAPPSTSTAGPAPTNPPATQAPAPAPAPIVAPVKALAPLKVALRRKGATLTGVRVTTRGPITLADGTATSAQIGDWQILSGSMVLAVLPDKDFPGPYEIVQEGTLILTKADRDLIEATTGLGTTNSAADLLKAISRLARIGIGDLTLPFTPGQLEEIAFRAKKRGITVERAMQEVLDRLASDLFHRA